MIGLWTFLDVERRESVYMNIYYELSVEILKRWIVNLKAKSV